MSKRSKDIEQKPASSEVAPNASKPEKQVQTRASNETVADIVRSEIANNPRFKEAKPSGLGFVIVGARPSRGTPNNENEH